MKVPLIFTTMLICSLMGGCSSTKTNTANAPIPSPTPAVTDSQKLAAQGKVEPTLTIDVPPWYIKAPASTEEYMFMTGTAVSSDLSMSRTKAMLDAQHQLADKLNGDIDAVVRQRKVDTGGNVTSDYTSKSTRKTITETSITGFHLEDSRIQPENRGYRTFVLIRYPIGEANKLLKQKLQLDKEARKVDDDQLIDNEIKKGQDKTVSQSAVKEVVIADYTKAPNSETAKAVAIDVAKERAKLEGGQVVQLSTTIR